VTFNAPNDGAVIAPGTTKVTVNATNVNGISRWTLFADNARVSQTNGAGPTFNWNWDASGAADGKQLLRANCSDGAGVGIPGVYRTVNVDSTLVNSTVNAESTPLLAWPLDFGAGTLVNWPETHFSTSESGVVSASDPSVPAGAPTNRVTRLVAGNDPLGGGDARSSIQQKYSVPPDNWNATHSHVDATGTISYDPYPAEYMGKDGVEGMERWEREAFAVPAGSQLPPGMIVSDWHAFWGVPIALRTAADGSANWELVIRGGKFEYAPKDPVTGVVQYPAWTKELNADGTKKHPYWSGYSIAAEGAPYPHPAWAFAQESARFFKVAPITQASGRS
jgi:Bacterial Ig domain